jgi:ABC-2 type transport system permease protein
LLNLFLLPFELVQRIYGEVGAEPDLTTVELVAANVAWTAGAALLVRERYRRLQVTR